MLNGGVYQVEDIAGLLPHLGLMGHRRGNVHPPTKTIYLDSSDRNPTAIALSLPQLRPLRLLWRSGGKIQKKERAGERAQLVDTMFGLIDDRPTAHMSGEAVHFPAPGFPR